MTGDRKLSQQEMMDWINSLNPITIDFDENDEPNPGQVNELKDRLKSAVEEIKKERQQ